MRPLIYRRFRTGFAAMTAIALLILVGAALVAMSSLLAADARRTRDAAGEVQLRQLFLAAHAMVARESRGWAAGTLPAHVKLELPQGLDHATVTISVAPAAENRVRVDVEATVDKRRAAQVLVLDRHDVGYGVSSVQTPSP